MPHIGVNIVNAAVGPPIEGDPVYGLLDKLFYFSLKSVANRSGNLYLRPMGYSASDLVVGRVVELSLLL